MIVSEARIEANRRNAQRSTGPKTVEGKERSRLNSLKHGLCATVVVPESPELIRARSLEWRLALKPQNDYHQWMVDEIAVTSLRVDRSERQERRVRDKKSLRAELFWDDDRKLEATRLGALIQTNPDEVVQALQRTPQGCEWLMTRWALLAHAADLKKVWTPDQKLLAFDLLATPAAFRDGYEPGAALDFEGRMIDGSSDPASIARREIAALKERRDAVAVFDEVLRNLAITDHGNDDDDPELKKIRRYETSLHSRMRWCLNQINAKSPYQRPMSLIPQPSTTQETMPESAATPLDQVLAKLTEQPPTPLTPKDHPPFDLEPHEYPGPDEVADIPAILAAREAKKRQKSANQRNQKRRKLEKLRAG